jgi:peptide/nickel transport system ATP-binding protein
MTAVPLTRALDPRDRGGPAQPLLLVRDLKKHFPTRGGGFFGRREMVQAVDGVSFAVMKGTTLGIVGESGCGKSTTARLLLHLIEPDAGDIIFDGDASARPTASACATCGCRCRWCFRTATRR